MQQGGRVLADGGREIAVRQLRAPRTGVRVDANPVDGGGKGLATFPGQSRKERARGGTTLVRPVEPDGQLGGAAAAGLGARGDDALDQRAAGTRVGPVRGVGRGGHVGLVPDLEAGDVRVGSKFLHAAAHEAQVARHVSAADRRAVAQDQFDAQPLGGEVVDLGAKPLRCARHVRRAGVGVVEVHDERPRSPAELIEGLLPQRRDLGPRFASTVDCAGAAARVDAELDAAPGPKACGALGLQLSDACRVGGRRLGR